MFFNGSYYSLRCKCGHCFLPVTTVKHKVLIYLVRCCAIKAVIIIVIIVSERAEHVSIVTVNLVFV